LALEFVRVQVDHALVCIGHVGSIAGQSRTLMEMHVDQKLRNDKKIEVSNQTEKEFGVLAALEIFVK